MSIKKIALISTVIFYILLPTSVDAEGRRFFDVPLAHRYYPAIKYLYDNGVIQGYADNLYRPEQEVNRAEFLKIVLGSVSVAPSESDADSCFPDIDPTQWYSRFVCYAHKNNIIQGYPDGLFRPGNPINKVEALKMIGNIQEWNTQLDLGQDLPFHDTKTPQWYSDYLRFAFQNGLIDDAGEYFGPDQTLNRAKIAEYVFRTMVFAKMNYVPLNESLLAAFIRANVLTKDEQTLIQEQVQVRTDLSFGARISFPLIIHYTPNGLDVSVVEADEQQLRFEQWADDLSQKNIGSVSLEPFNAEGESFLWSEAFAGYGLRKHRLSEQFLNFLQILESKNIEVAFDLKPLAVRFDSARADYISPEKFSLFLDTFSESSSLKQIHYRFVIEDFSFEYVTALERFTLDKKIEYDCRNQDCSGRGSMMVVDLEEHIFNDKNFGGSDVWTALALGLKKPLVLQAGFKSSEQNMLLFRLAHLSPQAIFFDYFDDNQAPTFDHGVYVDLLAAIQRWQYKASDAPKPIANLVLPQALFSDPQVPYRQAASVNLRVISSALLAAGYDIRVSLDKIIPESDLYYVLYPAVIQNTAYDLSELLYQVFRVQQKVFLQPIGAIAGTVYWSRLFDEQLGLLDSVSTQASVLPASAVFDFPDGPELVDFDGRLVHDKMPTYVQLVYQFLLGSGVSTPLTASTDTKGEIALLLNYKNRYLVNGSHLHTDLIPVLTDLFSPFKPYRSFGNYGVVTGQSRTALLSYSETGVNFQISGEQKIEQFSSDHTQLSKPTVFLENGVLRGYLPEGNIVLITSDL